MWKRNPGYFNHQYVRHPCTPVPKISIMFCSRLSDMANKYLLYCFQCYILWHIYQFYIFVDRAGAAAITFLAKEILLRLLVETKKRYLPKKYFSGFWLKQKKGTYIIVNTCRIIKQMCLQKTLNVKFSKWRTIRALTTSNLHI